MARIRTIKPEFWASNQVLECSRNARLLFIGLWNFCDDEGRHPNRPKQIKAEVFPGDEDMTLETIQGLVQELSGNGLIVLYPPKIHDYFYVSGWKKHQRIDKPQRAKYPSPLQEDSDNSKNTPGTFPPDTIRYDGSGREGTLDERILKEGRGVRGEGNNRASSSGLDGPPTRSASSEQAISQGSSDKLERLRRERQARFDSAMERSGRDPHTGERVTG